MVCEAIMATHDDAAAAVDDPETDPDTVAVADALEPLAVDVTWPATELTWRE